MPNFISEDNIEQAILKRLKELKLSISDSDVPETDFGNIEKASQLGVFDFRAFLNMAMLIAESDRARALRQMIVVEKATWKIQQTVCVRGFLA